MVYPRYILDRFVDIAKEFNLFLICDEIYMNVTYNGASNYTLSEYIDDIPGISLKGISKEMPWPGGRCGWMEFYNRRSKTELDRLCETLENAKMIEVSSTKLPQLAIPLIMQDKRYHEYIKIQSDNIGKRSKFITDILSPVKGIKFNETFGAFYNTIIFEEGVLNYRQTLKIQNSAIQKLVNSWVEDQLVSYDQRFVYYLLGAKGVCVVPISSFCSDLMGFRVTLLEGNETLLLQIFNHIKDGLIEYLNS